MKKPLGIVVLSLLLIWNVCAAENVKVVDGDTLKLNGLKIRFSGIDAPESNYKGIEQKCLKNETIVRCGTLSKEYLIDIIGNNKVFCEIEKKSDKYKRKLGECFVNNQSLSKILVRNGFAFDWPYYSKGKYAADQEYAKQNKLGLWNMKFEFPWDFRKNN